MTVILVDILGKYETVVHSPSHVCSRLVYVEFLRPCSEAH